MSDIRNGDRRIVAGFILGAALLLGFLCPTALAQQQGASNRQVDPESPEVTLAQTSGEVWPSSMLIVTINNLDKAAQAKLDPASFRLRIDGYAFKNVRPEWLAANKLSFNLKAMHQDPNWVRVIQDPPLGGVKRVSIGIATSGVDLPTADGRSVTVALHIFSAWWLLVCALIGLALIILVLWLGAATTKLLDPAAVAATQRRPYSLARCQMAFWFVVITVLFLVLSVITADYNHIVTAQSLTLLGISSATGLASIGVDHVKAARGGMAKENAPVHLGFFQDLLTDDSGWALHRVQILVWTLILGAISVWSAWHNLTLPDFDSNLLILMGISSGVYLGFKVPEVQSAAALPQRQPS